MNAKITMVLVGWLLCIVFAFGQTDKKESLQIQKIKLQDEIALANKILAATRQDKDLSVGQVEALIQKIGIRERLIRTMQKEIDLMSEEIEVLQKQNKDQEKQISKMREEYAEMIRAARTSNSNYSRLMFLLSSKSFNQAFQRMEYMKQIAEHRRLQVEEIVEKQELLEEEIIKLNNKKTEKLSLLKNKEKEISNMQSDMKKTEEAIGQLNTQEKDILQQIETKRTQSERLEKEIQRIIIEEIKKAKAAAERKQIEDEAIDLGLIRGKDFSSNTSNDELQSRIKKKRAESKLAATSKESKPYILTPEAQKLADNFTKSKGSLPWPVARGIITSSFGRHPHAVAKGVVVNNNGIDIATENGSKARAVYDGEVSSVIRIPYGNIAVLIRHGNYFTVYDNLVEVYVKKGDVVKTKQEIGLIFTDTKDGKTSLHFEVWLNQNVQNPQPWLYNK